MTGEHRIWIVVEIEGAGTNAYHERTLAWRPTEAEAIAVMAAIEVQHKDACRELDAWDEENPVPRFLAPNYSVDAERSKARLHARNALIAELSAESISGIDASYYQVSNRSMVGWDVRAVSDVVRRSSRAKDAMTRGTEIHQEIAAYIAAGILSPQEVARSRFDLQRAMEISAVPPEGE